MTGSDATDATVWQDAGLVATFLEGVQGGIPYGQDQIEIALRVLSQLGRPIQRLADLGSGDGQLARAVLAHHPDAEVVLVDFSEPMLERARQLMDTDRTGFVVADLGNPDWIDKLGSPAPFDAIVSRFAIHHLPHDRKQTLYHEIFDLLEPGGMFVNIEHVQSMSPAIERVNNELFVDSLFNFHQQRGTDKSREEIATAFFYRDDKQANILASVEAQLEWLRQTGFEDVDCFFKVFELCVFGGRRPR